MTQKLCHASIDLLPTSTAAGQQLPVNLPCGTVVVSGAGVVSVTPAVAVVVVVLASVAMAVVTMT